ASSNVSGVSAAQTNRNATSARIAMTAARTDHVSVRRIAVLSPAPLEQAGHRVIPDHAHQRAGRARQPPDRLLIVDRECDTDSGEQADAAYEIENQEAANDAESFQALVAISQEVVEQEIAGHRQDRTEGLR